MNPSNLCSIGVHVRDHLTAGAEWFTRRLRRWMFFLHQHSAEHTAFCLFKQFPVVEHPSEFPCVHAYNDSGKLIVCHVE